MIKYFLYLFFIVNCFFCYGAEISNYHRVFIPGYNEITQETLIAIRVFNLQGKLSFLVVDPFTLNTKIISANEFGYINVQFKNLKDSLYLKLLRKHNNPPFLLENKGITHLNNKIVENALTIDLCPSIKPIERNFFLKLKRLAEQNHKPTPVAISISGLWIIKHKAEFLWLQKLQRENKLAITWVNHSFSHVYYRDLPYNKNFLLRPETNLKQEVLLTEQLLIENGEIPSVFFRLPGLVSNKHVINTLIYYALIPLGADAWLAKDQEITPGGIILVHGNGNEPEGIKILMPKLDKIRLVPLLSSL